MTEVRICEILKSEAMRHRALARLSTIPQLEQAHLEVAEALDRAAGMMAAENNTQPNLAAE